MNELVLELRIKNDEIFGCFSRFITIFMYLYIFLKFLFKIVLCGNPDPKHFNVKTPLRSSG